MEFQNCILINFEPTHGRTGPKQYAPSTFSKLGGGGGGIDSKFPISLRGCSSLPFLWCMRECVLMLMTSITKTYF